MFHVLSCALVFALLSAAAALGVQQTSLSEWSPKIEALTSPAGPSSAQPQINACPVNGPMLSARGRDVAIAWFTVEGGQGRASTAFSRDAGRTFSAPVRLDDTTAAGRVDVELMPDGTALASWIEFAGQGAQFRVRRVSPAGERSPAVTVSNIPGSRASGYPRIGSNGREILFAWTEDAAGTTQVRTAVARIVGGPAPQ